MVLTQNLTSLSFYLNNKLCDFKEPLARVIKAGSPTRHMCKYIGRGHRTGRGTQDTGPSCVEGPQRYLNEQLWREGPKENAYVQGPEIYWGGGGFESPGGQQERGRTDHKDCACLIICIITHNLLSIFSVEIGRDGS